MPCPNTLAEITKLCDVTLGFKNKFYIAREDEITTIPAAVDGVVSTAITMVATKLFYAFSVSETSGKSTLTAETEGEDATIYNVSGQVTVTGITGGASAIISDMRKNLGYIAIMEDKDGQKWLLGNIGDSVVFKPALTHDGSVKEYTLAFAYKSKVLPLEYTSTIPIA